MKPDDTTSKNARNRARRGPIDQRDILEQAQHDIQEGADALARGVGKIAVAGAARLAQPAMEGLAELGGGLADLISAFLPDDDDDDDDGGEIIDAEVVDD